MAHATSDAEQLAREYIETIWNEREYAKIRDLISESFVMYDPAAIDDDIPGPRGEVHGRDGLETFIRGVVAGFPDFHVALLDTLSSEDTVMYAGRITLTHEGTFYWIPPTGRSAEFRYMGMIRIEDGNVQEHRVYPPLLDVVEQLGFTSLSIVPYLPKLVWAWIKHLKRSFR